MIGKSQRPGFGTVTPYLLQPDVDRFVSFLERAFGAEETHRARGGAGGLHVEVRLGDSVLMVGGDTEAVAEPQPVSLFLYVEEVDGVYRSALAAGATSLMEPADGLFQEKRGAGVRDPFGNSWYLGEHAGRGR